MTLLLLAVIAGVLTLVVRLYARATMVLIATIGLLAYSVPALVGQNVTAGLGAQRAMLVPTSSESILAMTLGWLGYGLALVAMLLVRRTADEEQVICPVNREFMWAAATISVGILGYMMAVLGPLFFLETRGVLSQALGFDYLIWRWVNILGIIASIATKSRSFLIFFSSMVVVNLLIGDRTMITIALFCAMFAFFQGKSLFLIWKRPGAWVGVAVCAIVIFLGKSFYVSIKEGLPLVDMVVSSMDPAAMAMSYEPFATHYILDRVISYDLSTEWSRMFVGLFGQLLIVPSLFGIDSSSFNVEITQILYNSRLTYGIAANYWAQGYALAGYAGVVLFGVVFGLLAFGCDRLAAARSAPVAFLAIAIGVVAGVYIHRNSLENYAALVRQIALSTIVVAVVGRALMWLRSSPRLRSV